MSKKSEFGNRMKGYENITRNYLINNLPVIIRIDGKAFHTYTKAYTYPFSEDLRQAMLYASNKVAQQMQGFVLGYHQSDEVSFFIENYSDIKSEMWFNGNIQKIASVSASLFTGYFNEYVFQHKFTDKVAFFDARVYSVPKEDVINYFFWRYKDNSRNFIQALASLYYSHKERTNKNSAKLLNMVRDKGVELDDIPHYFRYGTFFYKELGCTRFDVPI